MKIYIYLIGFISFFSCDVINPEEEIPAFIEIESFEVLKTDGSGSNSQNITEAWVYVDRVLTGAFSKNKPFPVLSSGLQEILIDPGIHENGIGGATTLYPYYTRYTVEKELIPGETTKVNPVFEYRDNIEFLFIEEFDNATIFTDDKDGDPETKINFTTVGALEGSSAKITLNTENPIFDGATSLTYPLPLTGPNDAFLEVNFKTDAPIAIGLIYQDEIGVERRLYGHGLNTSAEWKKIYINLKEIIVNNPSPLYKVGFAAILPEGQTEATIMLDNMKLLHFKL